MRQTHKFLSSTKNLRFFRIIASANVFMHSQALCKRVCFSLNAPIHETLFFPEYFCFWFYTLNLMLLRQPNFRGGVVLVISSGGSFQDVDVFKEQK